MSVCARMARMTIETRERAAAAHELAAWTSSLELRDVPDDVRAAAREHLLDTLGCGLAALGVGEGRAGLDVAGESGSGPSSAIGRADGVPASAAALANGMLCHGLDFDDTHEASIAHVATVVVPASLAAAEARRRHGRGDPRRDRRRDGDRDAHRHGRARGLPPPRLPPHGRLRDLRRHRRRLPPARDGRGGHGPRARARGQHGLGHLRVPRRRLARRSRSTRAGPPRPACRPRP